MVFALHQLDKKKKINSNKKKKTTTLISKKKKKKKKKKKCSGFATFTVTSIVKKTKQNLTLSELLEGKKMKEIEKGLKIFDIL